RSGGPCGNGQRMRTGEVEPCERVADRVVEPHVPGSAYESGEVDQSGVVLGHEVGDRQGVVDTRVGVEQDRRRVHRRGESNTSRVSSRWPTCASTVTTGSARNP